MSPKPRPYSYGYTYSRPSYASAVASSASESSAPSASATPSATATASSETATTDSSTMAAPPDHHDKGKHRDTTAAFTEVVDPNYASPAAPYRLVSSDNVAFYLSAQLVAQCPYLYQVFGLLTNPEYGFRLVNSYEDARSLRLVFDLISGRSLAGDMASWPPLTELGNALRLAKRLEVWAVYALLAGYIQNKLLFQNWGRQSFDVFRLAGAVGDDKLARFAVDAMQRQSDANLAATSWSEDEVRDGSHLPSMLWCPGTWTPEEFDAIPPAYTYALARATVAAAVPYEDKTKAFGSYALAENFAHFLSVYRKRETRYQVSPPVPGDIQARPAQ